MDLDEGDDRGVCGGEGGVFPQRFYNKAGDEVDVGREADVNRPDPRKRHMDRPSVAPDLFIRGVDLDG